MKKTITQTGMGLPGDSYRHSIGLGEGNCKGHADVYLWAVDHRLPDYERRKARNYLLTRQLRDRIAQLIEDDIVCQRILEKTEKL